MPRDPNWFEIEEDDEGNPVFLSRASSGDVQQIPLEEGLRLLHQDITAADDKMAEYEKGWNELNRYLMTIQNRIDDALKAGTISADDLHAAGWHPDETDEDEDDFDDDVPVN